MMLPWQNCGPVADLVEGMRIGPEMDLLAESRFTMRQPSTRR